MPPVPIFPYQMPAPPPGAPALPPPIQVGPPPGARAPAASNYDPAAMLAALRAGGAAAGSPYLSPLQAMLGGAVSGYAADAATRQQQTAGAQQSAAAASLKIQLAQMTDQSKTDVADTRAGSADRATAARQFTALYGINTKASGLSDVDYNKSLMHLADGVGSGAIDAEAAGRMMSSLRGGQGAGAAPMGAGGGLPGGPPALADPPPSEPLTDSSGKPLPGEKARAATQAATNPQAAPNPQAATNPQAAPNPAPMPAPPAGAAGGLPGGLPGALRPDRDAAGALTASGFSQLRGDPGTPMPPPGASPAPAPAPSLLAAIQATTPQPAAAPPPGPAQGIASAAPPPGTAPANLFAGLGPGPAAQAALAKSASDRRLADAQAGEIGNKGASSFLDAVSVLPPAEQSRFVADYNARNSTSIPVPGDPAPLPAGAQGPVGRVPYYAPNAAQAADIAQKRAQAAESGARVPLLGAETRLTTIKAGDQGALDGSEIALRGAQGRFLGSAAGKNAAETQAVGPLADSLIGLRGAQGAAATENAATGAGRLGMDAQKLLSPDGRGAGLVNSQIKDQQAIIDRYNAQKVAVLHGLVDVRTGSTRTPTTIERNIMDAADANIKAAQHQQNVLRSSSSSSAATGLIGSTGGVNGCATTVCRIAQRAGLPVPQTASARDLESRLPGAGWVRASGPAQANDIVTMPGRGPSGRHVGWSVGGGQMVHDPGRSSGYSVVRGAVPAGATVWRYQGRSLQGRSGGQAQGGGKGDPRGQYAGMTTAQLIAEATRQGYQKVRTGR